MPVSMYTVSIPVFIRLPLYADTACLCGEAFTSLGLFANDHR
jgi:hypothetical protein